MTMLSKNFSFEELTNTTSYPKLLDANRDDAMSRMAELQMTANGCQAIRDLINAPLNCSSGYRNPALNKAVGGSTTSKHMEGTCADISSPAMNFTELFSTIRGATIPNLYKCIQEGVKGKEWVHCEFRKGYNEKPKFYTTNDGRNYDLV